MASAPVVGGEKPAPSQGTTYRLALFTTEPSISQLDLVLTGSGGEATVQLLDGPNCKWVWSSVSGPAHNSKKNQVDVYDVKVPDVGDISSVKLQFDVASATTKGFLGSSVDDYNFKHIEILRLSGMRDVVFVNPDQKTAMKKDKTFVVISSPSSALAAAESHVKLPSSAQSPSASGGLASALPSATQVPPSPSAAGGGASAASDPKSTTLVIVSVLTGDNGMEKGLVSIKFHGSQGESAKHDLDGRCACEADFHAMTLKEDDKWAKDRLKGLFFGKGQETFFRVETKLPDAFGEITAVTLYHEPAKALVGSDDWVPHQIGVSQGDSPYKYFEVPKKTKLDAKTKEVFLSTFQQESVKRVPTGFLEKTTSFVKGAATAVTSTVTKATNLVVPADPVRPKKNWDEKAKDYLIEVKTRDEFGSGTDMDVEVTIVGKAGECVVVLKEHPLNPARLEAEEPGKDFFETSGVDRFFVSVPTSRGLGDEIRKVKVRLLPSSAEWDKTSALSMKAIAGGVSSVLATVTRDKWNPEYIKIVDYERFDGNCEYYFNCGSSSFGKTSGQLEFFPTVKVEKIPENPEPATEEHDFIHFHDSNDPAVPKPEPKGFFGFSKKKEEPKKDEKKKAEKDGSKSSSKESAEKDAPKDSSEDKAVSEEPVENGLGDEDDEDPDTKEHAPKDILKKPAEGEKKTIEKGPYRVYVQISEARDLVGKKENLMAEPVFQVSACGQKELTRNKGKKCRSLFVNQLFIFDFEQKELFDMDLAKIQISYLDGGSLFSTLLGSYEFDMSIIYHQDKHEIANIWVALLDASGESLDIKGFVKLSIAVVGEQDELPVHNDDDEDEEASMDMTQCLMPPNLETKKNSLSVVCLKGEGFPQLSSSKMEFFAEAAFGAKRARSMKDTNKCFPQWNEALRIPFVTPSMANDISISFKNSRRTGKNQTVGTLHVSLKDVSTLLAPDGTELKCSKYTKPHWFNIYGTPLEIQKAPKFEMGDLMSSFAKAVKQSNMGLSVGTSFCGRVLLAIEAKEDATAFRSVKGQIKANVLAHLVDPKSPQFPGKPLMNPTYYKCRIVLHEGCQFKSDYVIVKAIFGNNSRQTDVCSKNTESGTFDFYYDCSFPGDLHMQGNFTEEDGDCKGAFDPVNGLPDVIIEVWNKDKSSRLAYMRVPVSECKGTQCNAQWRDFKKCPFSTSKGFPGFLLASISVEQSNRFVGDQAVYHPQKIPERSMYFLVSHVYMGRSLPSADPNGLSDPYVEIYCGGSKAVSSVRPETLNPVWYENMVTKVKLPVNRHLRRPLSVQVWDQDFGSGALASLLSDDFLGSADVSWKVAFGSRFDKGDLHTYAEPTQWIHLTDPLDGSRSGEILLSFQLFPESQFSQAQAAGEMNIVPEFIKDCQLQITALGCRSLAPFGIRSVNNPLIEFDLASSTSSVGAKGHQGKKKKVPKVSQLLRTKRTSTPTGSDPNFSHTFNVNVNVPLNPLFSPVITIRCIDSWLFGLKTPMVGTGRILLESLVQPLISANKLRPADRLAPPKTDKDFIELGDTMKQAIGNGRENRLDFVVNFQHYPTAYWQGVRSITPWAQWAKEQSEVPMSRHFENKDFLRILFNCFKFMHVPLPSLPHSAHRLIDALFKYCRALERVHIDKCNIEIDRYNSNPAISQDERKERLAPDDSKNYDVLDEPMEEVSAKTVNSVWSSFAAQHPNKSQEQIVRLYHLPSMLSSFSLDSDESILLRKCYERRWVGFPQEWQNAELAGAGQEMPISAMDLDAVFSLYREIMSAATPTGEKFQEQHFAVYKTLCSMTISVDVFFDFVLARIYAELDIDGDKYIDLKESQRLLERMGFPCSFEVVKSHYCSILKVLDKDLPNLFNFDQLKSLINSIKSSASVNTKGSEIARASYGSDVGADIVSRASAGVEMKPLISASNEKEDALSPPPLLGRGADMFASEAEAEKESDEVMPYMRGRATIRESLDHAKYIGEAPFSTFRLLRGQKKGGFFSKLLGSGEEVEAGIFKGCVTLLAPKGSELQNAIETARSDAAIRRIFPVVPKAPNVEPKQVVVRLYVLKGYNMYCEDDASLYLRVKLGKKVMQDTGKVCKGNNQLEFYQSFELRVELPGVSQLEVSVIEKNFFGFDTVIGSTTLDLEDRWYNEKWRQCNFDNISKETDPKLQQLKRNPVEECTLRLPSNRMPQGKISCWLDIMTEKDAAKEPMFDISLVPPAPFELRLVLWKARNMPSMETVAQDMNDLYLVASLISQNGLDIEKETDIHWRAKKGNGSFNWRMKFNFTLPQRRPRLRISAWDQDIFGANDAIGECQMPLTKIFKQAWKAYCAKVRPDPLALAAAAAKSKDGKAKDPVSSSKNIIEYPPKAVFEKNDPSAVRPPEFNDEPAWVKLQRKGAESGGEVAFQLALMEQSVADARPVGDERKEPNRDPQLPAPDRVRWSLLHPWDMLFDILGPDLYRKFMAALCVICCLSVTITILYFVGPLILGNVLGAVAAKRH